MTAIDLAGTSAPASRVRRIVAHARMEAGMTVRNGEQLLLALVIPIGLLVGGLVWGPGLGIDSTRWPASVLALALWSTSFTSLAITTAFERRYGVLERLSATPLRRTDLLAGKALATAGLATAQLLLLGLVAALLGWRPTPSPAGTLVTALTVLFALFVFACFALTLSGLIRAEATIAVANLVYLLLAAGGGIMIEVDALPAVLQPVVAWLPTALAAENLRGWVAGSPDPLAPAILLIWAVAAFLLARKVFRWLS